MEDSTGVCRVSYVLGYDSGITGGGYGSWLWKLRQIRGAGIVEGFLLRQDTAHRPVPGCETKRVSHKRFRAWICTTVPLLWDGPSRRSVGGSLQNIPARDLILTSWTEKLKSWTCVGKTLGRKHEIWSKCQFFLSLPWWLFQKLHWTNKQISK